MNLLNFFLVFIGGGAGAVGRFGLSLWMKPLVSSSFPWSTLTINLIGSFCIGLFMNQSIFANQFGTPKLLLMVGLLGGFTTFSAFSMETVQLCQRGDMMGGLAYVVASLAGTIALTFVAALLSPSLIRLFA